MLKLFRIVQGKQLPTFELIEHFSFKKNKNPVASSSIWARHHLVRASLRDFGWWIILVICRESGCVVMVQSIQVSTMTHYVLMRHRFHSGSFWIGSTLLVGSYVGVNMGSRLNMGVVLKNSRSVLMVDCIDQHVQIGLVPSWEMLTVFCNH